MFTIKRYTPEDKSLWDAFIEDSKNGTFLFLRDYMDYHSDRFVDHSLLFYNDKGKLTALLPANINGDTLYSHQGLTYGGLIMSATIQAEDALAVMESLNTYLAAEHISKVVYKPVPHIYHRCPAEEDMYALFRHCDAKVTTRNIASVVYRNNPLRFTENRRRGVRKAQQAGVTILESEDYETYWHLLSRNLNNRFGVFPVHSVEEITRLHEHFPSNIRLFVAMGTDGVMLAGVVLYVCRSVIHCQYISASDAGRRQGALDLLFHYLLTSNLFSIDDYPYFDFGTSNEDGGHYLNEGLIHQKQGFGARAVCYDTYEWDIAKAPSPRWGEREERLPYLSLQRVTAMHHDEIQQAVNRVVSSGWYLQGTEVKAFEEEFANYLQTRLQEVSFPNGENQEDSLFTFHFSLFTSRSECVSCANGLDALTLILRAYKEIGMLHDGDEVIVPANTYIATILSITENRLTPVLVEPRINTFQIDDRRIAEAITPRTRAIMLVHLYGYNSRTAVIDELCQQHNLLLIQDCAQCHGLPVSGTCAWSFYPGKNLGALGDAGAVTTDDPQLAATIRTLANYGSSRKYIFDYEGRNSRMDEIQAAVLRVKLKYLNENNHRRQEIAKRYINEITNPQITLPPLTSSPISEKEGSYHASPSRGTEGVSCVFHIFPILCSRRDELQQYLQENGVQTMIHYPIPPHKQKAYIGTLSQEGKAITEQIHREELSLPCNQTMTDEEVTKVIRLMNSFR